MQGRNKFVRKLGSPQKARKKNQNQDGKSSRNADKKSTKAGQNDKMKERHWNMWEQKRKGNTRKTAQLEEINQKVLAKEGRLKRYRQSVKQYRQNRTFQNNERKFYQQLGGHDTKTYQQPDAKETEWFWTKIWQPKNNEKAE